MVVVAALGSALLVGCAEPAPPRDPLVYLRVGVDPREEATALSRALEREGYAVRLLVDTEDVVMLDALRADGASAVRVVTDIGVALGLDAPDRRFPTRERVRGLRAPLSGSDLDGDGRVELLIVIADHARVAECVAVVRLDRRGRAQEVPVDTSMVQEGACAERAEDVGGDARAELLVVGRFALAGLPVPASVAIPLTGFEGRFVPMEAAAGRYYQEERGVRMERLGDARRVGDARTISRLAVELGLLALFEGGDPERAVLALDAQAEGAHVDALAAGRGLIRGLAETARGRASTTETE
ncbi:MAG: hypothetical protein KC593_14250 [Myxococcales bacterium]|nr:hypothetical protein [Myxococcales bacterium]MCB9627302.1 hypothetical protein [Sandaracinaceae bacterium]